MKPIHPNLKQTITTHISSPAYNMYNMYNQEVEGVELSGTWLPDGVMFTVCSFMCRKEITDVYSSSDEGLSVPGFFHDLSLTSKDFNALLHRYFRQIPVILNLYQRIKNNYERIEWACHNEVKLGHCHLYVRGKNEAALCEYIVSSCNLAELESCAIHLVKDNRDVQESEANDAGIPVGVRKHIQNDNFLKEFQNMFASYVPTRAISLRSLTLTMKGVYCPPLLGAFSNTLECLELTIFAPEKRSMNPAVVNYNLQALSEAIEKLTKLKKLKIRSKVGASFTVRSDTLEVIETTDSRGFYVDYCECKSLKKFICDYKLFYYSKEWSNGVKPLIPFNHEDIDEMSDGEDFLKVKMTRCSFSGLMVPDNCTVRMKTK